MPSKKTTTSSQAVKVVTREDIKQLASGVVFLDIVFRGGSLRRKQDTTELGADAEQSDMLHMRKDLVEREELRGIRSLKGQLRAWLSMQAVSARVLTRPGIVMIPVGRVEAVEEMIAQIQVGISEAIETFLDRYPAIKTQAKKRLKALYKEDEYPTPEQIRAAYRIEFRWMIFETPDALSAVSKELYEREQERLQQQWREAWPEVRDGLREGFAMLIKRMAESLEPDPKTGNYRNLREPLVIRFHEFLNTFSSRNVTNDEALERLVAQAKSVLNDATAKELRGNSTLRDRIAAGFESIAKSATKINSSGARRVTFADDQL